MIRTSLSSVASTLWSFLTLGIAGSVLIVGCAHLPEGDEATETAEAVEANAPHVLFLTAQNAFHRDASLDATIGALEDYEAEGQLSVTLSEDLAELERGTLEEYDAIMLNNTALRLEGDTDVWRAYHLEIDPSEYTGDAITGHLVLYGDPDDLGGFFRTEEGIWQADDYDERLSGVTLEDSLLTFVVSGRNGHDLQAEVVLDNASLSGAFHLEDDQIAIEGAQMEADDIARQMAAVTLSVDHQDALMQYVREGGGFVGAGSALQLFPDWEAYRELIGGAISEGLLSEDSLYARMEEPEHPATGIADEGLWVRDVRELDENPRWNARVLSSIDLESLGIDQGSPDQSRDDHPFSWVRGQGEGRVFMAAADGSDSNWGNSAFRAHFLQGVHVAAGDVEADVAGHRVREVLAEDVWPHDIALDRYNNVWIAELRGKIHLYDSAEDTTRLVAELETTDPTNIEHGLFGIEVDPDFHNGEPYIYLFYTEPVTFINTLSRFVYRDGTLDLDNEEVLLRVPTEPLCCHQAGDIEWGPDGTLYLSTGDTGMSETRPTWELEEERLDAFVERHDLEDYHWTRLADSEATSQNLQELRGKVLRINRDGSIPHDNPFFGETGVRWEIFAYGMRNPFQFTVDQETGNLYIAVVGPDGNHDYAEYNVSAEGGENFGWPRSIGRLFYNEITVDDIPNYHPPMWEYTYETGGRSPFNGPVYRHEGEGGFPDVFQDKVFILDWARNWIKWASVEERTFTEDMSRSHKRDHTPYEAETPRYVDIRTFDTTTDTSPMALQLGTDGALYFAEFDGFWDAGPNSRLTRYRWVRGLSPEASASASQSGERTIQFDGSASRDPDAGALSYEWSFGDGHTSTAARPEHTYDEEGTYTVTLVVTDSEGLTSEPARLEVTTTQEPVAGPEGGD